MDDFPKAIANALLSKLNEISEEPYSLELIKNNLLYHHRGDQLRIKYKQCKKLRARSNYMRLIIRLHLHRKIQVNSYFKSQNYLTCWYDREFSNYVQCNEKMSYYSSVFLLIKLIRFIMKPDINVLIDWDIGL
jgi:hypothetical protein